MHSCPDPHCNFESPQSIGVFLHMYGERHLAKERSEWLKKLESAWESIKASVRAVERGRGRRA